MMKISKCKKELARIISENGGWRDGAKSAAQCKSDNAVSFYRDIPDRDGDCWWGEHLYGRDIVQDRLIANWHQTILSRAEYFHLYQEPDADGWIEFNGSERPSGYFNKMVDVKLQDGSEMTDSSGRFEWDTDGPSRIIAYRLHKQADPEFCESVMRSIPEPEAQPTIEQLAADYRNKLDYANRKQDEADKANMESDAALAQLEDAIAAIGFVITPLVATEKEPELVITDWLDLRVGDEVECVESNIKPDKYNGRAGRLHSIDEGDTFTPYLVDFGGEAKIWCCEVKFIRRP